MFTGIIQAVGRIAQRVPQGGDLRLRVDAGGLDLGAVALGDSIATNGVCLTVTAKDAAGYWADVSAESVACSTLGALRVGDPVNLELALTPSTRLGGHLVSGHVDGVGEVVARRPSGRSTWFRLRAPDALARYIAAKGSICIDGISLTVNAVDGAEFELNVVPHTLAGTTLGDCRPGRRVNLEIDLVARYLERLLLGTEAARPAAGVTRELLAAHGFAGPAH
ncbi:MAG TPA: riboflavin synthase [Gammaproteobacteria bacterium]